MKGDRAVRSCAMVEDHWNTSTHRLCYNERFDNCGGSGGGTKYEGVIRTERGRPKKRLRTNAESPASVGDRRDRWLESRMDEDIEADPTSPKLVICTICRAEGRFVSIKFNPKAGSFDKRVQDHLNTHTDAGALTDKQLKKMKENERAAERRHRIQTGQTEPAQSKRAVSSPAKQTRPLMQWLTPEKQQRRSTESGQDADDGPDDDGEMGGTLSHL
jgi:hypothetical protein